MSWRRHPAAARRAAPTAPTGSASRAPSPPAPGVTGSTAVPAGPECGGSGSSPPGRPRWWGVGVFLAGLAGVALGFALAVRPGPLTIPPVLLGLWVWSTEFEW